MYMRVKVCLCILSTYDKIYYVYSTRLTHSVILIVIHSYTLLTNTKIEQNHIKVYKFSNNGINIFVRVIVHAFILRRTTKPHKTLAHTRGK